MEAVKAFNNEVCLNPLNTLRVENVLTIALASWLTLAEKERSETLVSHKAAVCAQQKSDNVKLFRVQFLLALHTIALKRICFLTRTVLGSQSMSKHFPQTDANVS